MDRFPEKSHCEGRGAAPGPAQEEGRAGGRAGLGPWALGLGGLLVAGHQAPGAAKPMKLAIPKEKHGFVFVKVRKSYRFLQVQVVGCLSLCAFLFAGMASEMMGHESTPHVAEVRMGHSWKNMRARFCLLKAAR